MNLSDRFLKDDGANAALIAAARNALLALLEMAEEVTDLRTRAEDLVTQLAAKDALLHKAEQDLAKARERNAALVEACRVFVEDVHHKGLVNAWLARPSEFRLATPNDEKATETALGRPA